ncbi:MAG: hypothetical protein KBO60_21660 [Achromobacter sp.]|nr:hypothetical protein [Achromobacter sp.]
MRATTPMKFRPMVSDGRISASRCCTGSSENATKPDDGSQPSARLNSSTSRMPSTNTGAEKPATATTEAAAPDSRPR